MTSEAKKALVSGLYDVVDQQCNADHIRNLLKRFKEISDATKKEILISGPKDGLIRILKRAVSLRMIPIEEVYQLVRDGEENGQQHIFLYTARTKPLQQQYRQGEKIGAKLFPDGLANLPRFDRKEESIEWADFRTGTIGTKVGWLGKLYGHQRVMRLKSRKRTDESMAGFTEIRKYKAEDYNTVYVVRWSNPDSLEVRVDSAGAHKADVIPSRLGIVWDKISPAVSAGDFEPFRLIDAMTAMLVAGGANKSRYEFGTCSVHDAKHGTIDFKPYDPDESLDTDIGRAKALKDLLANGAKGRRLVIRWKKCEGTPKELDDLRTEIAGDDFNELDVRRNLWVTFG